MERDRRPEEGTRSGGDERRPRRDGGRDSSREEGRREGVRPPREAWPEKRRAPVIAASEGTRTGGGSTPPAARTPRSPLEGVRISKLMTERGLASRREADEWIVRGWVIVDGAVVKQLGTRALPSCRIDIDPEARRQQIEQVTILVHKPVGYVSGQPEPGYKAAVTLVVPENQWKRSGDLEYKPYHMRGLAPAGRLDIDSTGLLVLTQDGRIARRLIGDESDVEKEYLVRVEGNLSEDGLTLLNHGLSLDGKVLRPARVKRLNQDQLHFILREGKKRQIRRMCELVGLKVVGLKRVRIGRVGLADLPVGKWRYLRPGEVF